MPTVTIDYFGVTGSGRNVTEAKRDAGAKLERFVASYRPRSIHYRGTVYVIWTEPDGGVHSEQIVYRGEVPRRELVPPLPACLTTGGWRSEWH